MGRIADRELGGSQRECRICGHGGPARGWRFREFQQGTWHTFDYQQCSACQSLQIRDIPPNLGDYYGGHYYSYSSTGDAAARLGAGGWLRGTAATCRDQVILRGPGPFSRAALAVSPAWDLASLRLVRPASNSRILDVGAGAGDFLRRLSSLGFTDLTGIDPFLPAERSLPGFTIHAKHLEETTGSWDVITLNHVFEHVADPAATLVAARERLSASGRCIIRTPTVDSWAWHHFQSNWVGLDPPRHLHIFSRAGLVQLARNCGLVLDTMVDDSTSFQFWGGELVERGIATHGEVGTGSRPAAFRRGFLRQTLRARKLNAEGRGDSIAVILRHSDGDQAG